MIFLAEIKGPLHTFNGYTANFYISTGQGFCSVGAKHDAKIDADYFCSSFYGKEYKSTSYEEGQYYDSGKLGYQMHKTTDCTDDGEEIQGTDCSGVKCKIKTTNVKNDKGLFNIVCSKFRGMFIKLDYLFRGGLEISGSSNLI